MKTKNKVQKTILRSVAVIVSFVLLSLTVTAQGYWRQLLTNNSFNQIAFALVEKPSTILPADNSLNNSVTISGSVDYFYEEKEASLEIEPWMICSGYFDFGFNSFNEVNESSLNLENWMFESDFFKAGTKQEVPLEVESWMTNDNLWKI